MRGLLTALFAFVLVLSHGTMSAAAPHSQGQTHHHDVVGHDHHDDDHGAFAEAADSELDESTKRSETGGQSNVGHVHVVGDMVSAAGFETPRSLPREHKPFPRRDANLASGKVAPLLEPPSA